MKTKDVIAPLLKVVVVDINCYLGWGGFELLYS